MSKFTKLIKTPRLFFYDSWKKEFEVEFSTKESLPKRLDKNLFNQISGFSASYPVNEIQVDQEYIWPYLRAHLWININYLSLGYRKFKIINPISVQIGHRRNLPYVMRKELSSKYHIKEIEELDSNEVGLDFLFITSLNAAEQVIVEDEKIYNRISDPLLEKAMNIGKARRLEMVKVNTPSLKKIISYTYKPILVFAPNISKSGYFEKVNLHRSFYRVFKNKIPSQVLNEKIMHELIDWEMHTRDYYIELLKKIKPKVIMFNGFHYYAPIISAADSLGIVTVDLQHGLQVGWNPLYNSWDETPREGYQAIPDYFAVWGKKEFDNITKVFNGEKHKPIILGNLWFEKQKNTKKDMSMDFRSKIKGDSTVILIAMQSQEELPDFYKEIIENIPNEVAWVIRHHPNPKGKKFKKKDFSKKAKLHNIIISTEVDAASWSQLLPYIDVTISDGSAVALEADGFGSVNIVTSDQGKENYSQEIEEEKFFFAKDSEEFVKIFHTLDLTVKTPRVNAFETVNVEEVLKTFLGKYAEKQNIRKREECKIT